MEYQRLSAVIGHLLRAILAVGLTMTTQPATAGLIFVNPGDAKTTAGHPVRAWTDAEKKIVEQALSDWKAAVNNVDSLLGDWTLRWEGPGLFKKWGEGGLDLLGVPAMTVRQDSWDGFPAPPKNSADFPVREIYFNVFPDPTLWFFDPTPATTDKGEPPAGTIDFLTVVRHELGHALGAHDLGLDNEEAVKLQAVMLGQIPTGVRRSITRLDVQIPEPSTLLLIGLGFIVLSARKWLSAIESCLAGVFWRLSSCPRVRSGTGQTAGC
jgi:PEP-CTERM motif